jgi:CheY-like chemotaxis protein
MQTAAVATVHSSPLLMVIDDDELLRASLANVLASRGFDVLEHASGDKALDALAHGQRPDLILLDLCMPEMDGWEFRQRQLDDARLASIPVVVISGDRSSRAAALSAAAFVAKPIQAVELLHTIESVLSEPPSTRFTTGIAAPTRQRRVARTPSSLRRQRPRRGRRRALALAIQTERQNNMERWLVARGLAHVVNNALQSLVSYVQCPPSGDALEQGRVLRSVVDQALACAGTLQKFNDCTTAEIPPVPQRELGLLDNSIVEAWRGFCQPANVELRTSNLELLRSARVPASALLVMVNELLANALESLAAGGGVVHVRGNLERRRLSELSATFPLCNRRSGLWCCLDVSDHGPGIEASALSQIWLPFYSTRFASRGLGLASVLTRMHALRGLVEARSTAETGTTLRLMFPHHA